VREFITHVDGDSDKENEESENRVLELEMKRKPEKHSTAAKSAGLSIHHKLNPHESIHLKTLTGMSNTMLRTIRSFLQQHGVDILCSEVDLIKETAMLKHGLESGTLETWNEKKKKEKDSVLGEG
jgi:hypothetical protein